MSIEIKSITISKESEYNGEAHVRLVVDDSDTLFLNKFIIDFQNGADVISTLKFKGTSIFGGTLIDNIKDSIKFVFQDLLVEYEPGLYKVSESDDGFAIEKLN